jgi:hypothetical protein
MIQDEQYNGNAKVDLGPSRSTQARTFFRAKAKGYQS